MRYIWIWCDRQCHYNINAVIVFVCFWRFCMTLIGCRLNGSVFCDRLAALLAYFDVVWVRSYVQYYKLIQLLLYQSKYGCNSAWLTAINSRNCRNRKSYLFKPRTLRKRTLSTEYSSSTIVVRKLWDKTMANGSHLAECIWFHPKRTQFLMAQFKLKVLFGKRNWLILSMHDFFFSFRSLFSLCFCFILVSIFLLFSIFDISDIVRLGINKTIPREDGLISGRILQRCERRPKYR